MTLETELAKSGFRLSKKVENYEYFYAMSKSYNTLCIIVDTEKNKAVNCFIKDTKITSQNDISNLDYDFDQLQKVFKRVNDQL